MDIIKKALNSILDFKSVKTKNKILIIESDDWGSLGTKNQETIKHLNKINDLVGKDVYSQFDTFASVEDLNCLFDTLSSVKDRYGKHAIITANTCMANPDFKRIKDGGFNQFYYHNFADSIKEHTLEGSKILEMWEEAIDNSLFKPQLHGREHLHSLMWLQELMAGNNDLLKAFELDNFSIPYNALLGKRRKNLKAALDIYNIDGEKSFQENWLNDSMFLFENHFGFKSNSFIPPAYTWHHRILPILYDGGVRAIQGIKLQYEPKGSGYKRKIHYTGQTINKDSKFCVRNVFFEPSISPEKDWVSLTMQGISKAFMDDQPAIIGSHRVNFIGSLHQNNRDRSLKMLKTILKEVVRKWPEVEFVSTDKLFEKI